MGMQLYFHSGRSMNPTLTGEDLLEVAAVGEGGVRRGDVIAFCPPPLERICVHRVTSVSHGVVITRGDNCDGEDPWTLKTADIIGTVVAARCGGRRRIVAGGFRGRLRGMAMRLRRRILQLTVPPFRITYRAIAGRKMFPVFLPSRLRPRVLAFGSGEGTTYRILLGRRSVARYDTGRRQWLIAHPWRLFVPRTMLEPVPIRKDSAR